MSNKSYWQKREDANLKRILRTQARHAKNIDDILNYTMNQVQKEIDSFYSKYARSERITLSEAKRRVANLDIDEYSRKAQKYVSEKNFSAKANAEMRLYNLTMKVNRLELLKSNIGLELVSGYDELDKFFDRIMTEATVNEFTRQAGILGATVPSNVKALAAVITSSSFHNATYSERIWGNQALLREEISKLLTTGLIQGKNPRGLARELRDLFGTSRYNAERLMRTEMARVQIEAQKQSFIANGYEEYEYICCHKGDACAVCLALAGEHFKVEDMATGENAPPMHPNCHCSTAAYMGREE